MSELAIVIPAFKPDFFRDTLASLAAQTSMRFHVYVGNDGGPDELEEACGEFPNLPITYHRFPENLGGTSLVSHWNRCVGLSSEPWVWLLSDDDVVSPECVGTFWDRRAQGADAGDTLYRFDTRTIDATGKSILAHAPHPTRETGEDFVFSRLLGQRHSFVVEYVFPRASFDAHGGFVDFPLAWCSDDATWYVFAGEGEIVTLEAGQVSWRASGRNITDADGFGQRAKLEAALAYLDFVDDEVRPGSERDPAAWAAAQRRWLLNQARHVMPVSTDLLFELLNRTGPRWPRSTGGRAWDLVRWNTVAKLKSVRGRFRTALRDL